METLPFDFKLIQVYYRHPAQKPPGLNVHHNVLLLEIQPNMPPILCGGSE